MYPSMGRPATFLAAPLLLAALAAGAGACLDTADLDRDTVTSVPPGNAEGSGFSGLYSVEVRTTNCEGGCAFDTEWFTVSVCDVGEVETALVQMTQDGGSLKAEWEEPLSLLEGGIQSSGAFDMGGFGTQNGGELEITLRVVGTIDDAKLEATARSWTVGSIQGGSLDCVGHYTVSAPRPTGVQKAPGPHCDTDADCANGNCNFKTDSCEDPGPEGAPCFANDDCAPTATGEGNCNNQTDTCLAPAGVGSPCFADDDCITEHCDHETDSCA